MIQLVQASIGITITVIVILALFSVFPSVVSSFSCPTPTSGGSQTFTLPYDTDGSDVLWDGGFFVEKLTSLTPNSNITSVSLKIVNDAGGHGFVGIYRDDGGDPYPGFGWTDSPGTLLGRSISIPLVNGTEVFNLISPAQVSNSGIVFVGFQFDNPNSAVAISNVGGNHTPVNSTIAEFNGNIYDTLPNIANYTSTFFEGFWTQVNTNGGGSSTTPIVQAWINGCNTIQTQTAIVPILLSLAIIIAVLIILAKIMT